MSSQDTTYAIVPTMQVKAANGITFGYRQIGPATGVPVIYLGHLASNLDNADPRIMDAMASRHRIIAFDYRGIGASSGKDASSIREMAVDTAAFIAAVGYDKVDIMAFSMGGFIAQELMAIKPGLVRKLILAGTGPRGGEGISKVAGITYMDMLKAAFTFVDPKFYLFFNQRQSGKAAARQFLKRLGERKAAKDKKVGLGSLRVQLRAIKAWGSEPPADLSAFRLPVLVVNGDNDRMVPTPNSYELARRLPNAELVIYEDAAHGAIFQYHEDFIKRALAFYAS